MNRRGFLSQMLKAGVGAMILPGAARLWKPTIKPVRFIVPFWFQTERQHRIISEAYQREFVKMFFFGSPLSELQIPESTAVIEPTITFRANMPGPTLSDAMIQFRESPGGPGTHPDFLKALKADIGLV